MSQDRTTEILNYLSAMSRDIGEFRQEFKQFRAETNARLDKIEARLDALEARVSSLEERVGAIESEMKEVKQTLATVRREMQIQTKGMEKFILEEVETRARVMILENRFDALEAKQEQSK